MRFSLLFPILCLLFVQTATAQVQSNDFFIRLNGPADTEPPSTPTLISVTPIAATQIDLAWTAATDNAIVFGYVVSRDGIAVATTTQLTYADTGLSASTTYSYTVRAFDPTYNYSSSSNSIATTTPAAPLPVTRGATEGTVARVVIDEFLIHTGISTTSFSLRTKHSAQLEVRWGRTASYELGYVFSNTFTKEHFIQLTDLEPGTTYEYEIIGYTASGAQTALRQGTFVTQQDELRYVPVNVNAFEAIREGNDVLLQWELPLEDNLSHVRVVRSHLGFPDHPQAGAIVYQGLQTTARDVGVLAQYSPIYYTAFVYDRYGNVSSGAVAIVYAGAQTDGGRLDQTGGTDEVIVSPITEATSTVDTTRVPPLMKLPTIKDILLIQDRQTFSFTDQHIVLNSADAIVISVPKIAVAGNLKSIIATIFNYDTKERSTFLLRINKDRTAYEARVTPLTVGDAEIMVEIYDYEAFVIGTYRTPVVFTEVSITKQQPVVFPDIIFAYFPHILGGVFLLLILISVYLFKRRGEDNGR
jgi:hypothetical protein